MKKAVLKELSGLDEVDYAMGLSNVEAKPGYFLTDKLTPRQFSEMMGLSYEEACILYAAYTADQEDNYGPIVGGIDSYTVSAMDMILFIYQEKEKGYVTLDDEDEREINDAYTQITDAQTQMLGPNYTRMVMNLNLPEEGTDTFAFLKTVHSIVEKYYDADDVYLVGNSTSDYDQSVSFARDNVMISVLSVVFVVLVLVFTFMSVGLPILLILVIQGSIWINFTFPTVLHTNIFFMSYLIVTSIQMGANIDYAIVISTWYSDLKTRMSPREALIKALDLSFPTVLTSGSILSAAGFLIGQITTEPSIVGIGQCLSRGTLISMFLVMFVLPQILVLGDRIVEKTSFQVKLPATPIASQRLSGTTFVNGRVRGRISGFVDAEIHGVVKGDISAIMSSGSYDLPEGSGQPPEAGASPEDTPNTPPADSVTGKEGGRPMKRIQKWSALLMAVTLLFTLAAPAALAAESTVTIKTTEDLAELSRNCTLDTWSQGKTVILENDLDLHSIDFTPIPTFSGTFQGNGHTISGLTLTGSGNVRGLFRYIQNGATVQDLTVTGTIHPNGHQDDLGLLAGSNAGRILNCIASGTVMGDNRIGGLVGINETGGELVGCAFSGSVTGKHSTAGVVGEKLRDP